MLTGVTWLVLFVHHYHHPPHLIKSDDNRWDQWSDIGCHPNATLAPQASQARASGENLEYMTLASKARQARPSSEILDYSVSPYSDILVRSLVVTNLFCLLRFYQQSTNWRSHRRVLSQESILPWVHLLGWSRGHVHWLPPHGNDNIELFKNTYLTSLVLHVVRWWDSILDQS